MIEHSSTVHLSDPESSKCFESQRVAFETNYEGRESRWAFHYVPDPLVRFLRDRRLHSALRTLREHGYTDFAHHSVLVVCGGVGGEGTFLRTAGFVDVTVSDFSEEALQRCRTFDSELKTLYLDTEQMDLPANSYDFVVVQDGLHHLPCPVRGFTEMLRVARYGVVVIEPHAGILGKVAGTTWEVQGSATNFVFRWNRLLLEQSTRSYLLSRNAKVIVKRFWDHGSVVQRHVAKLPTWARLPAAKTLYGMLRPVARMGNMMVGVVIFGEVERHDRLRGH